jgi:hypothetical protein
MRCHIATRRFGRCINTNESPYDWRTLICLSAPPVAPPSGKGVQALASFSRWWLCRICYDIAHMKLLTAIVKGSQLAGAFVGSPEEAWAEASELSRQLHITYKDKPFRRILSCAPKMYDELWGRREVYV